MECCCGLQEESYEKGFWWLVRHTVGGKNMMMVWPCLGNIALTQFQPVVNIRTKQLEEVGKTSVL